MNKLKFLITGLTLSFLFIIGCNTNDSNIPPNKARINIQLTDSPFPVQLISSTIVTIDKVEIRKIMESDTSQTESEFIVLNDEEMNINLLELTNGITQLIATTDLDPGYYDMIRLHVIDASVELNDGTVFDLKVPSGSTSGIKIKIKPAIQLTEGQTSDVLLDFDVNRSFVVKGKIGKHINGFNFKPVIRAVYMGAAGRIEGTVTDTTGVALENAMVSVWMPDEYFNEEQNDENEEDKSAIDKDYDDYKSGFQTVSTFTDIDGNYKLIGLPEGMYSVMCEMEGFKNDTINDISVTEGNSTTVNFELIPNAVEEVVSN